MGRKSLTGSKISPIVRFHLDSEVQAIIAGIKARDGNISEFIRDSIKAHSIAKKLSKFFTTPEVVQSIPQSNRESFFESLTSEEKALIVSLKVGKA